MSNDFNLTILQSFSAMRLPNNRVLLTRKFMEATLKFAEFWPGSITVLMEETNEEPDALDLRVFNFDELSFKL